MEQTGCVVRADDIAAVHTLEEKIKTDEQRLKVISDKLGSHPGESGESNS